jgi:hypothetical protein
MSCGDQAQSTKEEDAGTACLRTMDYRYEALLTKADIAEHVNIDEASYTMEISPTKDQYGSCVYEWNSDRPDLERELLGQVIKYPDVNRVAIKMLTFYSDSEIKLYSQSSALTLFAQSYKKLSPQEYNDFLANLKKEYANDPAGFEQAKGFLDQRMQLTYEVQENLGDRAYWRWHDEHGIELVVLSGTAHFTIASKTQGTSAAALADAVKFAREVLAKCG